MKKITKLLAVLLVLASLLTLAACSPEEDTQIKIGVLKGPTGMGAVKAAKDSVATANEPDGYTFTFYETANVAQLNNDIINGTVDIAALPINACAALFNKSEGKIEVIATNALGVLSIVGGSDITSVNDLKGKTIHTTGKASTPEYIINYILDKNGMNAVNDLTTALDANGVRVIYHADGNAAIAAMKLDAGSFAMLPEPAATVATTQGFKICLSVTDEWAKVSDTKLVQGCLVVNKAFAEEHPKAIEKFLKNYKASVDYINKAENIDDAAALLVEYGIVPKAPIAKQAIPRANIVCEVGKTMKNDVEAMLTVLHTADPKSVGGKLPTDDFYGDYDIAK